MGGRPERVRRGEKEKKRKENRGRSFKKGKKTFTGEEKLYPRAFFASSGVEEERFNDWDNKAECRY